MITALMELASAIIGLVGSVLNLKKSDTSEAIIVHHIVIEKRTEHSIQTPPHRTALQKSDTEPLPMIIAFFLLFAVMFFYVRYENLLIGIVAILNLTIAILYITLFKNDRLDVKETIQRAIIVSAPIIYKATQLLYENRYDFSSLREAAGGGTPFTDLMANKLSTGFSPFFYYCALGIAFYGFQIVSLSLLIYELFLIKQNLYIRSLVNLLNGPFIYTPLFVIPINLVVFIVLGFMLAPVNNPIV